MHSPGRPVWDWSVSDLSRYRSSPAQQLRRHLLRISKHQDEAAKQVHRKLQRMQENIAPFVLDAPATQTDNNTDTRRPHMTPCFASRVPTGRMPEMESRDGRKKRGCHSANMITCRRAEPADASHKFLLVESDSRTVDSTHVCGAGSPRDSPRVDIEDTGQGVAGANAGPHYKLMRKVQASKEVHQRDRFLASAKRVPTGERHRQQVRQSPPSPSDAELGEIEDSASQLEMQLTWWRQQMNGLVSRTSSSWNSMSVRRGPAQDAPGDDTELLSHSKWLRMSLGGPTEQLHPSNDCDAAEVSVGLHKEPSLLDPLHARGYMQGDSLLHVMRGVRMDLVPHLDCQGVIGNIGSSQSQSRPCDGADMYDNGGNPHTLHDGNTTSLSQIVAKQVAALVNSELGSTDRVGARPPCPIPVAFAHNFERDWNWPLQAQAMHGCTLPSRTPRCDDVEPTASFNPQQVYTLRSGPGSTPVACVAGEAHNTQALANISDPSTTLPTGRRESHIDAEKRIHQLQPDSGILGKSIGGITAAFTAVSSAQTRSKTAAVDGNQRLLAGVFEGAESGCLEALAGCVPASAGCRATGGTGEHFGDSAAEATAGKSFVTAVREGATKIGSGECWHASSATGPQQPDCSDEAQALLALARTWAAKLTEPAVSTCTCADLCVDVLFASHSKGSSNNVLGGSEKQQELRDWNKSSGALCALIEQTPTVSMKPDPAVASGLIAGVCDDVMSNGGHAHNRGALPTLMSRSTGSTAIEGPCLEVCSFDELFNI